MKLKFKTLIFVIFFSELIYAQRRGEEVIRFVPCSNPKMSIQRDSIRNEMTRRGWKNVLDTSFTMHSNFEMALPLPLRQGTNYHFAFIANEECRASEVRLYDYNERMVVSSKKGWGNIEGFVHRFNHVAQFTEWHMAKPVQQLKRRKDLCGYFLIFRPKNPGE